MVLYHFPCYLIAVNLKNLLSNKKLLHLTNGFVREKLLCLCWDHKINKLIFKTVMLNFSEVPRGVKRQSRRKPATQFCALSKRTCNKRRNLYIKFIDDYMFIGQRVWSSGSVCSSRIIRYDQCGRSICGGLGPFTVSRKNKVA